jgi:hypothetical protein
VLAACKMKVSWPFGVALRGEASSHRMVPSGRNREALSTVAARAGGPARSSGEASDDLATDLSLATRFPGVRLR